MTNKKFNPMRHVLVYKSEEFSKKIKCDSRIRDNRIPKKVENYYGRKVKMKKKR